MSFLSVAVYRMRARVSVFFLNHLETSGVIIETAQVDFGMSSLPVRVWKYNGSGVFHE